MRHGHHLLPTFGAGKEFRPAQWRSIFRQLHAADMIAQDPGDRDRWVVTPAGRDVLAGEAPLELRVDIDLPSGRSVAVRRALRQIDAAAGDSASEHQSEFREATHKANGADLTATQHRLLATLKAKRLEIARAQKQPPFVIFHDSVLIGIAKARPRTLEELRVVQGVGPAKLERYGEILLDIVANHDGAGST
jgi:ATP-dependent DNA helicase RecQ